MYLLPVLAVFRARHPHIKVEVKRSLASRIASEVLGRGVEIGVVSFKPTDQAIASVPAISDELALIVAPSHPLAEKCGFARVGRGVVHRAQRAFALSRASGEDV